MTTFTETELLAMFDMTRTTYTMVEIIDTNLRSVIKDLEFLKKEVDELKKKSVKKAAKKKAVKKKSSKKVAKKPAKKKVSKKKTTKKGK